MLRRITPSTISPPLANYSHATEVPPNARWLYLSGQLGIAPDGSVPASFEAQAEACFVNLLAILKDAGMGPADLVRLNTYLVDPDDLATYMAVRDRHVAAPPPASTLLVVRAPARPEFKIEIEAVAAQIMEKAG
jgi:enamine deaminase RidA (YjgF/YER057c/UK114 family)